MRLEIIESKEGFRIINDCYNANYDSVKSALEFLSSSKGKRKIAILGDMLELGDFSKKMHEAVAIEVIKNKIDLIITVGKESKYIYNKIKENSQIESYYYRNNSEAIEKIKNITKKDDVILIKASNSMKFIEITNALTKKGI